VVNYFILPGIWKTMNRTTLSTLMSERKNGGPSCIPISQLLPLIHLNKTKSSLRDDRSKEVVALCNCIVCISEYDMHTTLICMCTYKINTYIMHVYTREGLYTRAHERQFVYTCTWERVGIHMHMRVCFNKNSRLWIKTPGSPPSPSTNQSVCCASRYLGD